MSTYVIKQTSGSGGGSSPVPPGTPTLGTPSYRIVYPESDGKAYAEVSIPVTWPDPAGTTEGGWLYLDRPDSYQAAEFGSMELGSSELKSDFSPRALGWVALGDAIRFVEPMPSDSEGGQRWRLYLAPGSPQIEKKPTRKGLPGESPNVAFQVDPPPAFAIGREYAPLAETLTASIEHDSGTENESGQARWRFLCEIGLPLNDGNFSTLGGFDIVLFDNDPDTEDLQSSVSVEAGATTLKFVGDWKAYPYPEIDYRLSVISFNTDGRRNTFAYGVTPSSVLHPVRPAGPSGTEFTGVVTLGTITSNKVSNSDGTVEYEIDVAFTPPSTDTRFGGVTVWASEASGPVKSLRVGSRLSPFRFAYRSPTAATSVRFYVTSLDKANQQNTVVVGVTPYFDLTLGSSAADLNLGRANNFTARMRLNGGQFDINVASISSEFLASAQIDVGGGGSKPSRFRVFDNLGSLIGWIGDDTASSGLVGAWFKKLYVGGSVPTNAPIIADASGNVTINGATFTLNLNSVVTKLSHTTAFSATYNLLAHDTSDNNVIGIRPGVIDFYSSLSGGQRARLAGGTSEAGSLRLYDTSGTFRAEIDAVGGLDLRDSPLRVRTGSTIKFFVDADGVPDFRGGTTSGATESAWDGFITAKINGSTNIKIPYKNA